MKKIIALILSLCILLSLAGCYTSSTSNTPIEENQDYNQGDVQTDCIHSWSSATCTEPSKCTICGQTNGSANGHTYATATCTTPQKCTVCGASSGSAAGHKWSDATCTEVQKCTVCGTTGSAALGHNDNGSGACSRCGADIILTALKEGFQAYLIIPSVGAADNSYVQVKFVNRTNYRAELNMHVYANGKSCANKQLSEGDYYLEPGYEIVITFYRDMFKTVKDMYLDNQSTAWTGIHINGEVFNLKFDKDGNTIWGRHPNDIGEY